jgi:hypothetical protein
MTTVATPCNRTKQHQHSDLSFLEIHMIVLKFGRQHVNDVKLHTLRMVQSTGKKTQQAQDAMFTLVMLSTHKV